MLDFVRHAADATRSLPHAADAINRGRILFTTAFMQDAAVTLH
jgi:hypothetical protein